MELRDIEIFLTLAEELHFGRTAERLHLTTPRVSQAIKKQERAIGAELFARTSRTVRLTTAGEHLRDSLRPAYTNLRESIDHATLAARGTREVLRVGSIPTNFREMRPFFTAFTARHPQWDLRLRHSSFVDPFGPLRRGEIDVLISWLPIEEPDLTAGPVLFTESRVVAAAVDHELAARGPTSLEVLGDHPVPMGDAMPEYWVDAFIPFHTPGGRPVRRGPGVANIDDISTLVSTGEIITLYGAHASRFHARPDVAYLPVTDAPPLRWGPVWRTDSDKGALIRAFAQVVGELGSRAL